MRLLHAGDDHVGSGAPGQGADLDEATIAAALEGNVCRCCTYPRIVRAARRATELEEVSSAPMEEPSFERPSRPWDLVPAPERGWFAVLPDGLVVAVEPEEWATSAGAWLHVEANGVVTPSPARSTSGRATGRRSLLVAAELEVPVDGVHLVMGDTDLCPYDAGTFGSRSMTDAAPLLRSAAAAARRSLDRRPLEPGERRVDATAEPSTPRPTEAPRGAAGSRSSRARPASPAT